MRFGSLFGWTLLVIFLLPAWAIKTATMQSRLSWVGMVLFFGFVGLIGKLIAEATPKSLLNQPGPYTVLYGPYFKMVICLCMAIAILLPIGFSHAEPGAGFLGVLGDLVSYLGSTAFPVVARYATDLQPSLTPQTLFQLQSTVSAVLLASIPCFVAYIVYALPMPPSELRAIFESTGRGRPSDLFFVACTPFALLIVMSAYLGWFEFDSELGGKQRYCLINAICYARGDDLWMLAAAGMKSVAIVGFPLGIFASFLARQVLSDRKTES